MQTAQTTDLLIVEMADAAEMSEDEATRRLALLLPAQVEEMAEMTADLMVRNIVAGVSDPVAAAHRRVGREAGLALRAALDAR